MRVLLSKNDISLLRLHLIKEGISVKYIADNFNYNERTVRGWLNSEHSMPQNVYNNLVNLIGVEEMLSSVIIIDEKQQKINAGKKGNRHQKLSYGNIASSESRSKGGRASYLLRGANPNDIFARKRIQIPEKNEKLAEFIGIMIGDGNVAPYQASISVNMIDDAEYVSYVGLLMYELFAIKPAVYHRTKKNCTVIVLSSRDIVECLLSLGLPLGDKIESNVDIPSWIKADSKLLASCLRGIFDTDGGIYQEKHLIKGKSYSYARMAFVSASPSLVKTINDSLIILGFRSKIRNGRSITLEQFTDIEKYFRIIGSSNPKHLGRYAKFTERSHSG